MSKVIKVENLSKIYRIGEIGTGMLINDVDRWWKTRVLGKKDPYLKIGNNDRSQKAEGNYVKSLDDLSFEIEGGDAVGIIGKNGAGKSTLLKILSRITSPTFGSVNIKGRVASLLEVGTGFHPDLTGRENIYLNGAIIGMRHKEITHKLDEIIDFSGVEKYIDTPVKRYSSGMYVRLAFAVAAHLESEIMIVDEVLAVGDMEFQKKCLGKMNEASKKDGRTVLFVSHNIAAVKTLCNKGILLRSGQLQFQGSQVDTIREYHAMHASNSEYFHEGSISEAVGNANIRIRSLRVGPLEGEILEVSSGFYYEIEFYNDKENTNIDVSFELRNSDDIVIFYNEMVITSQRDSKKGFYKVRSECPPKYINAGIYKFNIIFGENTRHVLLHIHDFVQFEIQDDIIGNSRGNYPGIVRPNFIQDSKFIGGDEQNALR